MMRFLPFLVALAAGAAIAADPPSLDQAMRDAYAQGKSVTSISPVYSQLVRFALPEGFHPVHENTKGDFYILEMVLSGETVDNWTQMVTLTGHRNLAANPTATPQGLAGGIAGGFKNACPDSFAAFGLGQTRTGGKEPHDAFAAVASCGAVRGHGPDHSETAMIFAIKGTQDFYTVQWAERGPASAQAPSPQDPKWPERLAKLKPIIVCPIIPGEPRPYPSCAEQP